MKQNDNRPQESHGDEQLVNLPDDTHHFEGCDEKLRTDGGSPDSSETDRSDDKKSDEVSAESCAEASLTPSVKRYIRVDRNHECELCGAHGDDENVELHIHHRVEKQNGGTDHPHNLLLLCQQCHRRHHHNIPIEEQKEQKWADDVVEDVESENEDGDLDVDATGPNDEETRADDDPLPPRSKPNGADEEILSLLEKQGPLSTGELAAQMDYSKQYIRRQCWKLSGELLVVPQKGNTWDLKERADEGKVRIGLPEDPQKAKRAGRDEVIRQMSAHGMAHTQIADITGLSRSTIDIAVNRARALRIDDAEDDQIDLATIATRLSALLELIDHTQMTSSAP